MTKRSPSSRDTSAAAKKKSAQRQPATGAVAKPPKKTGSKPSSKASVKAAPGATVGSDSGFARSGTRIIAVANQKGGVGKSTTAVSLGAALAERGHRVLVVDLDPQGNASTGLGIRHEARDVTVYDVLAAEAPIADAIVQTPVDGLFAIPSTIDLAGAEIELVSQFSRELRLRKALEPLKQGSFEFIFLDCPPSLGLLTVNALAAAEELLVPIQCEYYALEGLGQLLRNVRLVQQNVNRALRLTGIVMTMFDPRTKLSEQVVEEVRRFFGSRVYDTIIPRTVRLSEAPGFGQPITVYDPRSRGAESYRALAEEVAEREVVGDALPVLDEIPHVIATAPSPEVLLVPLEAEPEVETLGPAPPAPGAAAQPEGREPELEDDIAEESFDARPVDSAFAEAALGDPIVDAEAWLQAPEAQAEAEAETTEVTHGSPIQEPAAPEPRPEALGSPEIASIVVAGSDPSVSPDAESVPPAPDGRASAPAPAKKRWSLFRKGGDG